MKAILEFDLPKDSKEFKEAKNGSSYKDAMEKFSQYLLENQGNEHPTWREIRKAWLEHIVDLDL